MNQAEYRRHCEIWLEKMERIYAGETPEQPYILSGISSSVMPKYNYTRKDYDAFLPHLCESLFKTMDTFEENGTFQPLVMQQLVFGQNLLNRLFGAEVRYYMSQ